MPKVSYAAAKDHVHRVIETIAPVDSQERFEGLGVQVIRDFGRFISKTEVQAGDTVIEARRFVIATGSSPFVPPIPGIDGVPYLHQRDDIRSARTARASDHHRWRSHRDGNGAGACAAGVKGDGDRGAEGDGQGRPGDWRPSCWTRLRAEGVEIVEDQQAAKISGKAGAIAVETADGTVFKGSHLLMAVGRKVNIDRLDLDKARYRA